MYSLILSIIGKKQPIHVYSWWFYIIAVHYFKCDEVKCSWFFNHIISVSISQRVHTISCHSYIHTNVCTYISANVPIQYNPLHNLLRESFPLTWPLAQKNCEIIMACKFRMGVFISQILAIVSYYQFVGRLPIAFFLASSCLLAKHLVPVCDQRQKPQIRYTYICTFMWACMFECLHRNFGMWLLL